MVILARLVKGFLRGRWLAANLASRLESRGGHHFFSSEQTFAHTEWQSAAYIKRCDDSVYTHVEEVIRRLLALPFVIKHFSPVLRVPFSFYRGRETEILIVAVAHHKRRPAYWSLTSLNYLTRIATGDEYDPL